MESDENRKNDVSNIADYLELAILQITMSMKESDHSIEMLVDEITQFSDYLKVLNDDLNELAADRSAEVLPELITKSEVANEQIQKVFIAFQFYDRLSQRMWHIEENLRAVADLIQKPEQEHFELWKRLQHKLRSVYTFEQEQQLINAFTKGKQSSADCLHLDSTEQKPSNSAGEIELF